MTARELVRYITLALLGLAQSLIAGTSTATETRGYAISVFHVATYANEGNCPRGGNGTVADITRRNLTRMGYDKANVDKIMVDGVDLTDKKVEVGKRGHLNGTQVDVDNFPTSEPDPNVETVQGHVAYGFNLDGKGGPDSFEDPETHEKGINNQLWRAVGCYKIYDIRLPVHPFYEAITWDTQMDAMPAWIFSISGENLNADGDVTVTFDRAYNHLIRDVHGGAMEGVTFTIDSNPRSHSTFHGRIRDHVLTIDPGQFSMTGESPIQQIVRFTHTQLRLKMNPNGSLSGLIGGYQPWMDFYYWAAIAGETDSQMDLPGLYYSLRRFADGDPDPNTGKDTSISAAYWMEAVPAYLATGNGTLTASAFLPSSQRALTASAPHQ
jgi:hypothetical protein